MHIEGLGSRWSSNGREKMLRDLGDLYKLTLEENSRP